MAETVDTQKRCIFTATLVDTKNPAIIGQNTIGVLASPCMKNNCGFYSPIHEKCKIVIVLDSVIFSRNEK